MKATYKRYLATAFATVGLMSLGVSQTVTDPVGPSQVNVSQAQTPTSQDNTVQDQSASPSVGFVPDNSGATMQGPDVDQGQTMLDTSSAPKITLNGTDVNFADAQPGIINGVLMVPVRDVAEQLGATVDWDNDIKEASITMPSDQQIVTLDTDQGWLAMVNQDEESRPLRFLGDNPSVTDSELGDTQVVIIANRAYMPFDKLVACLNGTGDWDKTSNTADITTTTPAPDSVPSPDLLPPDSSNTTTPDNTTNPDDTAIPHNPTTPDNTVNPDNTTAPDNNLPSPPDNGGVDNPNVRSPSADFGNVDIGPVDQHTPWLLKG